MNLFMFFNIIKGGIVDYKIACLDLILLFCVNDFM